MQACVQLRSTAARSLRCCCRCHHHTHHHTHQHTHRRPQSPARSARCVSAHTTNSTGDTTSQQQQQQQHTYVAPTEAHLQHLAAALAAVRQPGDVYCLFGAVGAGKSTFSRAYVRAAAEDPQLPVPSPTYLLQIIYDEHQGPPIHHFDLYRLQPQQQQQQEQQQQQQQQSLARLNLAHSFSSAVSLIEWPQRLPHSMVPQQRLEVHIDALPPGNNISNSSGQQHHQQRQDEEQQGCVIPLPLGEHTPPHAAAAAGQTSDAFVADGPGSDSDSDPFADTRWRRVQLRAYGEGWQQRLQQLAALLRQPQ